MYPVSDAFKQKIKDNTREYFWTGTITTKGGVKYSFANKDIMKGSAYVNHKCCSNGEMEIGSVYAGEMKITLFNTIDRYTLTDAEITLTYHLKLDNGSVESVPMGIFIISEANRNIKTLEITAYDRMLLLDDDFKVTDMVGTPFEILSLMARSCGIELAQDENEIKSLTNGSEVYSIYADNDVETWRDVLYYMAQAMCCFATFNRQGKLELRQYSMDSVFEVNNTHRFVSSFSDFKTRYTAISSTNVRTNIAEYYALEEDNGLTMNLEINPMIQYGLQKTRERILNNILNKLSVFEYVPFDSQTIGNPALDVGDVIVFKGGHADEDSYSCITEFECRVNGKQTIKGVGKNPRLASAKSKNDKNIAGLLGTAEENKITYYNFVNAGKYTIGASQIQIISIDYVSTEETTAMFLAQIIVHVVPNAEEETSVLKITYKNGLEEVTTFHPMETYHEGDHTMALFYPLSSVEAKKNYQFNVFMNIVGGGSATIEAGNIHATISGQGLATGLSSWDGKITIEETFEEGIIWDTTGFKVERYYSSINPRLWEPAKSSITQNIDRVPFSPLVFTVNALDESMDATPVVKSFSVDSRYQPEYDDRFVKLVDNSFTMVTDYGYATSEEEMINYGRMSRLVIPTVQFESIDSLEVEEC